MAALICSLVGSLIAPLSMTVSLTALVAEVLWTTFRGALVATEVRGSPEGSPVATVWAGARARSLPVTNSFKFLQFLVGGLVVVPWYGVGPRAVGFVGTYWRTGFP